MHTDMIVVDCPAIMQQYHNDHKQAAEKIFTVLCLDLYPTTELQRGMKIGAYGLACRTMTKITPPKKIYNPILTESYLNDLIFGEIRDRLTPLDWE